MEFFGTATLWLLLAASPLRLVIDDRGLPIPTAVQACWMVETRQQCFAVAPGDPLDLPGRCDGLRIEGAEHGPASWTPCPGPEDRLTVPRKARLRVSGLPSETPVTLSLYTVDDDDFRRPSHRYDLTGGRTELWIPAGQWVASLVAGAAPDLAIVSAAPGATMKTAYEARPGWSALFRVLENREKKAIERAEVRLLPSLLGDPTGSAPPPVATDAAGFAILAGLTGPLWQARVEHPGFRRSTLEAVIAAPGTFTFEPVELSRGARLEAAITLDGEPAVGARCRLYDPRSNEEASSEAVTEWADVVADRKGVCRADRLPHGRLRLEVHLPESSAVVRRPLALIDGEVLRQDIELERLVVAGRVRRGEVPLPGWKLVFIDRGETRSGNLEPPVVEVTTDEAGEYAALLWQSGDYSVSLRDPQGTPAGSRMPSLSPPSERVDFDLAAQEIRGRVVNPAGEPQAEAWVLLKWQGRSFRIARTDPAGDFRFSVDTPDGEGVLQANHPEFRSSPEVRFELSAAGTVAPLELALGERDRLLGRLARADGSPAVGVTVQAFALAAGQPPREVGSVATDDTGRFRVPIEPNSRLRLAAWGAGCPLTLIDVANRPEEDLDLMCTAAPGALKLEVRDGGGQPVPGVGFLLRFAGAGLPSGALEPYLARLGGAPVSLGTGHLVLPGLPPGAYELFVTTAASEATMAAGSLSGRVAAFELGPGAVTELAVELVDPPSSGH